MLRIRRHGSRSVCLAAALVAGCGDSSSDTTDTAPTTTGDPGACDVWGELEVLELGLDPVPQYMFRDLKAFDLEDPTRGFFAISDDLIVESRDGVTKSHRPVDVNLAEILVLADEVLVVGDKGTLLRRGRDSDDEWEVIDLNTDQNLAGIVAVGDQVVISGDEVVFVRPGSNTWLPAPEPDGGWEFIMHPIVSDGATVTIFGDRVLWTTDSPLGTWTRLDQPPGGGGIGAGTGNLVVGAEDTILRRDPASGWSAVPLPEDHQDFVTIAPPAVILGLYDGRPIYDLTPEGELVRITDLGMPVARIAASESASGDRILLGLGQGSKGAVRRYKACP